MIPLFIDCSGRRIVIFGGGEVAARKAASFSSEAEVYLLSRSFSKKCKELPVQRLMIDVSTVSDNTIVRHLNGAFFAIGALSDPAQNDRIGRLCKNRGILFNNADGEVGDVIIPAVMGGKHYTLAISTEGGSPAVSRFIREHLDLTYPSLDAMIALQSKLRARLKGLEPSQERRQTILREVLYDHSLWESLERNPKEAWKQVEQRYLHG